MTDLSNGQLPAACPEFHQAKLRTNDPSAHAPLYHVVPAPIKAAKKAFSGSGVSPLMESYSGEGIILVR